VSGIDWDGLRAEARSVAARAHAPYSGFGVGAAGLADDGRMVRGCNVENVSYGLSLCAECGMVSDLVASGGGRLVALAVVAVDGSALPPCGRCRQVLLEVGGPDLAIDTAAGVVSLGALLPGAFSASDIADHTAAPVDPGAVAPQAADPGEGQPR
jgi:cytidine deaminase